VYLFLELFFWIQEASMYDLIIVGGGPAGLAAGIYAVRFGLKTLTLERSEITEVLSVHAEGEKKIVSTDTGDLESKAVIIATGANPKHLNVPGEKEFISKGVSYCAICDGPFFRNKTVVVVGGGNSAITDALLLSKIARKVYIIHRRDQLRAAKILQDRAFATPNIEFILNAWILEIIGSSGEIRRVEKVIYKDLKSKEQHELATDGVFIYVGIHPNTEVIDVEKDGEGFIRTDRFLETSKKGIYAVVDCRDTPIWQLVAAVRDGALAATAANEYIESFKKEVT
jgi:thioredoxin reductase (NADPH)